MAIGEGRASVKTLYLVRHGEASWQGDDYDVLTDRGEEQARIVGQALAKRGVVPDLVISGELRRHRRTAELAVDAAGWSVSREEDARWAEFDYIDIIKAFDPQYRSHGDLKAVVADGPGDNEAFATLFRSSLNGWIEGEGTYLETFEQFCARVADACDDVVERLDDDQTAVVFTSGGPIGALANRALEGTPSGWTKLLVSFNVGVSKLLLIPDGSLILVSLNDHSHLETAGLLTY